MAKTEIARRLDTRKPDVTSVSRVVREPGEHPREQHHRPAARSAHLVGVVGRGEAGADHDVGGVEPLEQPREVARVVLAVGVDLHRDVVAVAQGVAVAGAHRAAHAEVEGQRADRRAGRLRTLRR